MSCVLRVNGSDFLVDRFLDNSDLVPCVVYRKGEPRSSASKSNSKIHETSGLNVDVSKADFDNLDGQIRDAISFLEQHKMELERLCRFPGVERLTLDFGIAKRDVIAQSDYFPAELLYLAGSLEISIELSQYPIEN
jgi:hypothetical protein